MLALHPTPTTHLPHMLITDEPAWELTAHTGYRETLELFSPGQTPQTIATHRADHQQRNCYRSQRCYERRTGIGVQNQHAGPGQQSQKGNTASNAAEKNSGIKVPDGRNNHLNREIVVGEHEAPLVLTIFDDLAQVTPIVLPDNLTG